MPKKASTTPAKQQAKKTPTVKAETDTKWEKLSGVKATPKKQKTPIRGTTETQSKTCSTNLTYSNDADKFPHGGFPIRLDYIDGKDKRICWFQCYDHYIKHITRYKLTSYEAITNDVAFMGESTGAKSKQQRPRSR
jgi:hypothetical protein